MLLRNRKLRYDGFPGLYECWNQSKIHKKHFLDHLDCVEIQRYHTHNNGCQLFDKLIARWAGETYNATFFGFYTIKGIKPPVHTYTTDLVKDKKLLRKLAELVLIKKYPDEFGHLPEEYDDWPIQFDLQSVYAIMFEEDAKEMLASIGSCIQRRLLFRNACIRACCKRIDTTTHDNFLLILQILRARILAYNH